MTSINFHPSETILGNIMKILDIGWILLNVGMMPKILRYLIKVSTLLSKVRFSALIRRLELKKKKDFFHPSFLTLCRKILYDS